MTSSDVDDRTPPRDLSHYLSRNARSRHASSVKKFYKYFQIPGIGQLAGGLPNRYYFPFDTLEAKVAAPARWKPTPNKPIDETKHGQAIVEAKEAGHHSNPNSNVVVPHGSVETNPLKRIDLQTALQYGQAQGYPPLYTFLRRLTTEVMHPNIPYKGGAEIVLSCGNTDGFSKVLQTLTNEWSEHRDWTRDREGLLVEYFTYMNAIQAARPRGLNIVPVAIDDEGMIPEGAGGLRDVLANWDNRRGKRPHLIYTVTMGQNPTSGVLSLERRRELYAICSEYDVIICEDDPYWYLQFPSATHRSKQKIKQPLPAEWKSSGYDFLDSLVPSSLNIDTDGRVIRLDTFSKTVAPGCRLGWITAQPALIERILRITETSTQQPSGFVQSVIAEMIMGPEQGDLGKGDKVSAHPGWGADGWVRWIEGLRGNYERRMNTMCEILDGGRELVKSGRRRSLVSALGLTTLGAAATEADTESESDEWAVVEKTQIYSFDWPVGGMFVWVKTLYESHPLSQTVPHARLARALWIFLTKKPYLVLVAPGQMFSATDEIRDKDGYKFFRLCFAAVDEGDVDSVSQRFADGVGDFFRIKSEKKINDLIREDEEDPTLASQASDAAEGVVNIGGICF